MSSEMRESKFTNEDLETISRTWNSNKYTEHTAMLLASELLRARALLARTEAGPSLLCQSDACAHKGTVHNFCTPRTEAGADGAVSMNPIGYVDLVSWQTDWNAGESFFTDYQDEDTQPIYTQAQMERAIEIAKATHPQDASGDAVMREALERIRDYEGDPRTPVRNSVRKSGIARAALNAMQAKEAK